MSNRLDERTLNPILIPLKNLIKTTPSIETPEKHKN